MFVAIYRKATEGEAAKEHVFNRYKEDVMRQGNYQHIETKSRSLQS